ncbi:transposase family protein, partial [Acinetobacter baumannii]
MLALRRMAARRGTPKVIYSDNGTNFVGANKELKQAIENAREADVVSRAAQMNIKWKFIPPGAPNMRGAWERLVRSAKTALAVTLKERHPREEVLHTLLLEAE